MVIHVFVIPLRLGKTNRQGDSQSKRVARHVSGVHDSRYMSPASLSTLFMPYVLVDILSWAVRMGPSSPCTVWPSSRKVAAR